MPIIAGVFLAVNLTLNPSTTPLLGALVDDAPASRGPPRFRWFESHVRAMSPQL
jgi:hypothetical protein